ncbi:MAG: hypothetical protein K8H87_12030, partial [Pseudorhodoplanes sp.]|nr:hypothetical protein [Pseudorhodoplanes sp.]
GCFSIIPAAHRRFDPRQLFEISARSPPTLSTSIMGLGWDRAVPPGSSHRQVVLTQVISVIAAKATLVVAQVGWMKEISNVAPIESVCRR